MKIKEIIIKKFKETLSLRNADFQIELKNSTILLDSGLDSLGFAILVTKLEEEFGCDPFTMMDEPFYPRTFEEFLSIYEKYVT
jgi:acyl carrier protein